MFLEINDHHQGTNTKSQSQFKYSASTRTFILWDPLSSQQLLPYKLYEIVAIYFALF